MSLPGSQLGSRASSTRGQFLPALPPPELPQAEEVFSCSIALIASSTQRALL